MMIFKLPEYPANSLAWICEVPGCYYEVDPRDLTEEQGSIIGEENAPLIKSNKLPWTGWQYNECILKIISEHYRYHIHACGVRIVKRGKAVRVLCICSVFDHGLKYLTLLGTVLVCVGANCAAGVSSSRQSRR